MTKANNQLMRDPTARNRMESDLRLCALLDHGPSPRSINHLEMRHRHANAGRHSAFSLGDAGQSGRETDELDTDALVTMIARDLLAPLRNIEMLASQVRDDMAELSAIAARLDLITHASARLTRLSNDLLMFTRYSRPDRADVRSADLNSIVVDARDALGATARLPRIHWNIGELPKVAGIPVLLKAAFEQVLSNAVKFTQQRDPAVIEVSAIADGSGEVVIEIKDNGIGFNERHAHKLFGAFQRLHNDSQLAGAGLGLITAKRIVEGHGGRVWAKSRPDAGASFFFALPAAPAAARLGEKRVCNER